MPSPEFSSGPRARCWPRSWWAGSSVAGVRRGVVRPPLRPSRIPPARPAGYEQPTGRRPGVASRVVLALPSPGRRDPADLRDRAAWLLARRPGGGVALAAWRRRPRLDSLGLSRRVTTGFVQGW